MFVAESHGVWANPERKPSKRYGTLVKSPEHTLSAMLARHKGEVFSWISDRVEEASSEEEEEERTEARAKVEKDEMKD